MNTTKNTPNQSKPMKITKDATPTITLIKKLIRRHRRELTGIIGTFRTHVPKGATSLVHLASYGRTYTATASRGLKGERDWLCVNNFRGGSVACLD